MALGPGKYDDLATFVREAADAVGVVIMVFGGNLGEGFSVQAPLHVVAMLPTMLRHMADDLEATRHDD